MTRLAVVAILLIGVFLASAGASEFYATLLSYVGLSSLVALGLVLLTGIAGETSFGQGAFVGIAAYATAYVTTAHGMSPFVGLVAGLALTGCAASLFGFITVRLSGHFLPLGTVAWATSFYYLFGTLPYLGGYNGIGGIPELSVFGWSLGSSYLYMALIWICVLAVLLLTENLLDSRTGRAVRALNGRRLMAESMGVNTAKIGRTIFVMAALYAGLAGWLFAHLQRFVSPAPFSLTVGIEYLFMIIIGGTASLWGAVVGSAVVIVARDQLNDLLPRLLGQAGNFEGVVFALAVVFLLHRAPRGLWPAVQRWLRLKRRKREIPDAPSLPARAMPMKGSVVLDVDDVSKRFGGLMANDKVSFKVHAGEIVALIGPNGAGKSTLFDLISGVQAASSGTIRLLSDPTDRLGARDLARRGLGRSFQHVKLLPEISVIDNIALGGHMRGRAGVLRSMLRLDREEEGRILAEAKRQAERVDLGGRLDDLAGELPLGQQRSVEIARALCLDPCILLLDEPAAGLRHKEKQLLSDLLTRLRAEGVSVLLVEHDMDFVMTLADRIVVMDFGQKIAEGSPADVQRNPVVLEAYLGAVE